MRLNKQKLHTYSADVAKLAVVDMELECEPLALRRHWGEWTVRKFLSFDKEDDEEEGTERFMEVEEVSSGRGVGEKWRRQSRRFVSPIFTSTLCLPLLFRQL